MRVEDQVLIFDAGSGIRPLGAKLVKEFGTIKANLFFTHYHWDHIHGFPFFYPAYAPGNSFVIHGQPAKGRTLKEILAGQMARPYFPVPIEAMQAKFSIKDLAPKKRIKRGPAVIKTESLNHPGRALSYRVEYAGKAIVYASDHEHGDQAADERLVRHAAGADILIYDASYTTEEYKNGRVGWGHSTWQEGVKIAKAAGVRRLLLFHHEPSRNDRAVLAIEQAAKRAFRGASAAREHKIYIP
jgi:phosphoribosyl 1,2-cyclic phosphodiesterase